MTDTISRNWGVEKVLLSPRYFGALRLKYALSALWGVNGAVLEIGSGAGAFSRSIKQYKPHLDITASDIDLVLLDKGKSLHGDTISFVQADAHKLPFEDECFSAVVAFDVLEHLHDPVQAMSEVFRVLRPGGIFHSATPIEGNMLSIHGVFSQLGFSPKETYGGHIQRYTAGELESYLETVGFSDIARVYSGHYFYQLIDFSYFTLVSFLKKNPENTVEGYVDGLSKGAVKSIASFVRASFSSIVYLESMLLKSYPGVIGHYSGYKYE